MKYDVSIIGGGIVGLATALKIQAKNPKLKIVVLEKEAGLAKHQTGNNSGVIHSGLYYKPGSLKARNCLQGYKELVEFCQKEEIPFELTGKVVVATREEQKPLLENLRKRGLENGLEGTRSISLEELREFEPHCHGVAAIHVPQTGIVDYYQVALAYGRKFIQNGGEIKYSHKVLKINRSGGKIVIITSESVVETNLVVNCAGLYSDKIAEMTSGKPSQIKIIPFRGE